MMPIQAVIGIHALDELEEWVNHRRKIANIYNNTLKGVSGIRLTIPNNDLFNGDSITDYSQQIEPIYHSYYKYYFFIDPSKFKISRDKIIELINGENIFCQVGSCSEVYKEKALEVYKPKNNLLVTQELFKTAILLKCDPCISEEKATENINIIKDILIQFFKNSIYKMNEKNCANRGRWTCKSNS